MGTSGLMERRGNLPIAVIFQYDVVFSRNKFNLKNASTGILVEKLWLRIRKAVADN